MSSRLSYNRGDLGLPSRKKTTDASLHGGKSKIPGPNAGIRRSLAPGGRVSVSSRASTGVLSGGVGLQLNSRRR